MKLLSRVWLFETPMTVAYQAPSMGFSRKEYWSGLPFPSPMNESEKWKWSCSVVTDSLRPHGLQPTRLHPWDFPGKSTGVGCHCLLLNVAYPGLIDWGGDQKWPNHKSTLTLSLKQVWLNQYPTEVHVDPSVSYLLPVLQLSWILSVWTWFCSCSLLCFCVNHVGHTL